MKLALSLDPTGTEQDRTISETFARERGRLLGFIRRRVPDAGDAEDILQEVFYELVQAARVLSPIEQVGAWLFRVARNRIIDRFRRAGPVAASDAAGGSDDGGFDAVDADARIDDLLPAPGAGPEAAYARRLLVEELAAALDELPAAQRDVFLAHELDGRSFKELAAQTGVGINTLLARKHYAVRHLRRRLQAIFDEFET